MIGDVSVCPNTATFSAGHRLAIWPGVRDRYGSGRRVLPLRDLQERMLFAEALDAVDCLESGVLTSVADADGP
ncbi:fatty oxidation complex, alpha subunit FadB [Streptomyces griseus]|uniref:Fatty oxidation complex, alpha subunit FadB n=1 Tax=Streptomyces griseus TaxID=1911 RepID=A0A380P5Q3_STRGR|nr:fatty oxidation complex, alpha subunit FadB [Streptomyces griseus]